MKRIILFTLSIILLGVLSGCGGGSNTSKKYKLNLSVFGSGVVNDSTGRKLIESSASSTSHTYTKNSVTLTAIADDGYVINSWDGCNKVSDDLSECEVMFLKDNQNVQVNFTTTTVDIVSNFVDLSPTVTEKLGDTLIRASWADARMQTLVKSVNNGDYITEMRERVS